MTNVAFLVIIFSNIKYNDYLKIIYGEIPNIKKENMTFFYKSLMSRKMKTEMEKKTTQFISRGTYYNYISRMKRFNEKGFLRKPFLLPLNGLKNNSWIEIFHFKDTDKQGFWMYPHVGTGIFYNLGKTIAIKNHKELKNLKFKYYNSIQITRHIEQGVMISEVIHVDNFTEVCPSNLSLFAVHNKKTICNFCNNSLYWFNCNGFPNF